MLPVYVLSLKQDIEKRKIIKEQLNCLEIPFEFIDAIYGKDLPQEFCDQLKPMGKSLVTGDKPTPGEIGCALSHLKIYEQMLQRGQGWACIFEDDAIIDFRLQDFLVNYESKQSLFNRDNLYLLGGQNGVSANILVSKSIFSFFHVGKQKLVKIVNSEEYVCRTCCYIISDKIAKRIIDLSKSIFLLADDWEYLVKNKIIKDIYLSDFIDHPLDLSSSTIEHERRLVQAKVRNKQKKKNLLRRLVGFSAYKAIFYFKVIIAQIYRFKR